VQAFKIRHLGGITGFHQRFKPCLYQRGRTTTQYCLLAKQIGLEGLQVSFSTPGSDFDLRDKAVREQYYQRVDATGIRLASLGMGVLNQMPLATHPEAIDWVSDAIDAGSDFTIASGLSQSDAGFVINPGRNFLSEVFGPRPVRIPCRVLAAKDRIAAEG